MDYYMRPRIGIMQGRLLPPLKGRIQAFPRDGWEDEFPLAQELGFQTIEFIFDDCDDLIEVHPLLRQDGRRRVQVLTATHKVTVDTVCTDYFMRHPFHGGNAGDVQRSRNLLTRLTEAAQDLGISQIVIPCVDQAALRDLGDRNKLIANLKPILRLCETTQVRLALETDLNPEDFRDFLNQFESLHVGVNYDVGNSAALGYGLAEEWEAYGEWVSSVHVKDRMLHGPSVPLGTGSGQFDLFFRTAHERGYHGLFIIQGARGKDNVQVAKGYKAFVRNFLEKYYGS